jgi:hypothetical protein
VNDYVHKSTRGIATLWLNVGYILGETFAMVFLFKIGRGFEPTFSFMFSAAVISVFGLIIICLVVEHKP